MTKTMRLTFLREDASAVVHLSVDPPDVSSGVLSGYTFCERLYVWANDQPVSLPVGSRVFKARPILGVQPSCIECLARVLRGAS